MTNEVHLQKQSLSVRRTDWTHSLSELYTEGWLVSTNHTLSSLQSCRIRPLCVPASNVREIPVV